MSNERYVEICQRFIDYYAHYRPPKMSPPLPRPLKKWTDGGDLRVRQQLLERQRVMEIEGVLAPSLADGLLISPRIRE